MLRSYLYIVVLVGFSGMSSSAELAPGAVENTLEGFRIVIDPELVGTTNLPPEPGLVKAWQFYAMVRVVAYNELAIKGRKNPAVSDYEIELMSRRLLAMYWAMEQASDSSLANPYLDKLVAIELAGFMEEYVLYFFLEPGWTVSAESLALIDFEAFANWGNANLGSINHPTLAIAESEREDRPQISSQPGATLPDPDQFNLSSSTCTTSGELVSAAALQWSQESALMDGTPVSAAVRNEFIAALIKVRNVEPYRTQGMTWVSKRAGFITHLAGFCAVETENLLDAEWWLRIATALMPLNSGAQLELLHVLIMELRYDAADAMIDEILASSTDSCNLAGAWRRRGYIRFEQGKLDVAHAAYTKSLEYDPNSRLALAELQLLDQILAQNNETAPPMPPPSETLITQCQAQ